MNRPAIPKGRRLAVAVAALALAIAAWLVFGRPGTIVLTGIVTTDDVIVSPEIQGRLERLQVKEGDTVRAGQILGTIQSDEWKADFDYYKSSERQAASAVAQGEADLAYQRELTEGQIRQAEANLASAQSQVAASEADLENARLGFERETELRRSGTNSVEAYDSARTAFDGSRARLASTRKAAAAAAAVVDLAQANLSEVRARKAALEGDTSQLAAMEAQRRKAGVRLGYTELRAPIDGIVDVRAAREGEVVNAGQAVLTLVNPDDLWVRADIEESYITDIRLGDVLKVRLPSGDEIPGTIFFRGVDADYATQRDVSRTKRDIKTFEIRLRCDNRDRRLALGMTAYVILPRRR
jgi:multidrug resistance efflux pump